MLLVEAFLTLFAWFRGWRFYALLPIAGVFTIGAFMGVAATLFNINLEPLTPVLAVPDVIATIVLIVMASRGTSARKSPVRPFESSEASTHSI